MLNSAEHEILNAHKYKKHQEIQHFSGSDKPRTLFFLLINVKMATIVVEMLLINVKMPTFVSILSFISMKNYMLS